MGGDNALSTDRVVLVSGANRGIGRVIAERLATAGFSLSLGARDPRALDAVLQDMESARIGRFRYDARGSECAETWVRATVEQFGRVDGLVNNAAMFRQFAVDNGDIALQRGFSLSLKDDAGTVTNKLNNVALEMLDEALEMMIHRNSFELLGIESS